MTINLNESFSFRTKIYFSQWRHTHINTRDDNALVVRLKTIRVKKYCLTKLQTMALKMSQITTQGTALGTNFAPCAPVVSTRYSSVTRRESSVVYYFTTYNIHLVSGILQVPLGFYTCKSLFRLPPYFSH